MPATTGTGIEMRPAFRQTSGVPDELPSGFAQIETLPAEQAGKILSARSVAAVRNLRETIGPLMFAAGIFLLICGSIWHNQSLDAGSEPERWSGLVALWTGGLLVAGPILAAGLTGSPNKWLYRIARRAVGRRPGKIVDPDAAGVRFVEVVPRSNWNRDALQKLQDPAADVGFLAVNAPAGWLLFEGDQERYRIPAGAIVKCGLDSFTVEQGRHLFYFHFVVVTIKVSENTAVEIPFRIRGEPNYFSDQKQREANYELMRELDHLRSAAKMN